MTREWHAKLDETGLTPKEFPQMLSQFAGLDRVCWP
jgi:hypothetical protein